MGHAGMAQDKGEEMFLRGVEAVDRGDTPYGLFCLEELFEANPAPIIASYYAVCLAKERGEADRAVTLCREAMEDDPGNQVHYLNFGRVLVAGGKKREGIKVFRDGLLYGRNHMISRELDALGWRKPPVFTWLRREHPINKSLGLLFHRLGLR